MIITLLGTTGAGKSTLGKALAAKLNIPFLSTGEMLRALSTQNSPLGRSIKNLLAKGKYAPTPTIKKILTQQVSSLIKTHKGIVLDGFPRTIAQAKWLDTQTSPTPLCALLFDISESVLLARLAVRGRFDDNPTLIKQRFHDFKTKAAPLIPYYTSSNRLIKIDATPAPEKILNQVLKLLNN